MEFPRANIDNLSEKPKWFQSCLLHFCSLLKELRPQFQSSDLFDEVLKALLSSLTLAEHEGTETESDRLVKRKKQLKIPRKKYRKTEDADSPRLTRASKKLKPTSEYRTADREKLCNTAIAADGFNQVNPHERIESPDPKQVFRLLKLELAEDQDRKEEFESIFESLPPVEDDDISKVEMLQEIVKCKAKEDSSGLVCQDENVFPLEDVGSNPELNLTGNTEGDSHGGEEKGGVWQSESVGGGGNYQCSVCGKAFQKKGFFMKHQQVHTKELSCTKCRKSFEGTREYRLHLRRVHGHRSKRSCRICGMELSQGCRYSDHMKECHQGFNPILNQCQICNKTFKTELTLKMHLRNIHSSEDKVVCEICGKTVFKYFLKTHLETVHCDPGIYACPRCPQTFPKKAYLKYHMGKHEAPRYMCKICGKGYWHQSQLVIHEIRHSGQPGFKCDICAKEFYRVSRLNYHKRTHENDRRYPCSLCPKAYFRKQTLSDHMNTHSGQRPYVCTDCGDTFAHSAALFTHTKRHKVSSVTFTS